MDLPRIFHPYRLHCNPGLFDVLSPYYSAILWAAILAVIFNPVKNKIRTRLGERNGLAALMTIVIICLIVLRRWLSFLSSLAYELNLVYSKLQHNDTQFPTVVASLFAHLPAGPEASSPIITLIARSRSSSSSLMPL